MTIPEGTYFLKGPDPEEVAAEMKRALDAHKGRETLSVTVDFTMWQGRLCRFFAWLGWASPADYFAEKLVDRAMREQSPRSRE